MPPKKLALLGVWHVHARHHLEWSRINPGCEIDVVWDRDAEAGTRFAAAHGLPFEPDLDAVLARTDLAGVVIDNATVDHPAVIGVALARGKHVFTEKVLAVATADALDLARRSIAAGLVLHVSLQRLGEAPVQTMQALVEAGAVGRPTASRIRYAHDGALGAPWLPAGFLDPRLSGGGALIDLGAHPIYLGMLFHGAAPVSVRSLFGTIGGNGAEHDAALLLEYPGGAISVAETSFLSGASFRALEVTGTEGIVWAAPDGEVFLRRKHSAAAEPQVSSPPLANPLDRFVAALDDPAPDREHLLTAVRLTQIAEASYRAAADGTAVQLEALHL